MVPESRPSAVFRFGTFEFDVRSGELRRQGVRVRIQEQPRQVLLLLLQRAGQVVTREELRAHIWHSDTFVDFDNGLNTSINRLRDALKDTADNPRFIETLPRRGYRFIAPVSTDDLSTPSPSKDARFARYRSRPIVATTAAVIVATLVGAGLFWRRAQAGPLTEKDTIVVADFVNNTGDPVFDGTLRQGVAVQLQQSPFFSLVSDEQIQRTLRLMKRPADARLTPDVARVVCQRVGSTAVIAGSIAQIGARYTLILTAVNCANGESLQGTEAQAADKSHVLEALGAASSQLRKALGESRATIEKFDTPLVQASTSSLEALQAYSLGYRTVTGKGDSASAIPMFQRAVQLDPSFAMAYALLGTSYWNLGEATLAAGSIRTAFDLRAAVSEEEKLRIESEYYSLVTADLEQATRALEVWSQTYPRDWSPRNQLGAVYLALGQNERALALFRDALRLYPQSGLVRGNVMTSCIALDRLVEARAAADAVQADPDAPGLRINLYRLAFLQRDVDGMEHQVASARGVRGLEDELLWNDAATATYFGQFDKARRLYRQAVTSAQRAEENEAAAGYEADAALREAMIGNGDEARQGARAALQLSTGTDVEYRAALTFSVAGDVTHAVALADDLVKRFPTDTIVQRMYLPAMSAQIALAQSNAREAIDDLQPAASYEQGAALFPAYLRGLAFLAAHRGHEASAEFQRILDHPGLVMNSIIGALAHLQIGRAFVMSEEFGNARVAYQDFLRLWGHADPDLPVLKQAQAELARLRQ